jgi:hypothetical protein
MENLPKERAMAQLSRPYQIAFVAMAFLVLVWFVALRGHSASPGSTPAASTPAPTAASQAKAAAPSSVYHGAAPGVEGLTRAIAKAHGAVATSQQNAKQLQERSAQASDQSGQSATPSTTVTHATQAAAPVHTAATATKSAAHTQVKPRTISSSGTPSQQKAVESELKQGKVVLLLFWNPKASVDEAVHRELQAVGHKLGRKIAVHDALAKQVGSFGSITRAIQVYQTPTILLVNRHGVATTLTGLTDVFSIEQTITEARHA